MFWQETIFSAINGGGLCHPCQSWHVYKYQCSLCWTLRSLESHPLYNMAMGNFKNRLFLGSRSGSEMHEVFGFFYLWCEISGG